MIFFLTPVSLGIIHGYKQYGFSLSMWCLLQSGSLYDVNM